MRASQDARLIKDICFQNVLTQKNDQFVEGGGEEKIKLGAAFLRPPKVVISITRHAGYVLPYYRRAADYRKVLFLLNWPRRRREGERVVAEIQMVRKYLCWGDV